MLKKTDSSNVIDFLQHIPKGALMLSRRVHTPASGSDSMNSKRLRSENQSYPSFARRLRKLTGYE